MLVLASQSPRRSEILRRAGISFIVKPAGVDESVHPGEKPEAYAMRVARAKASAIESGAGDIVLGADTVVIVGDEMLGKPRDAADAARMLARLSGREHQVITGICLRRNTASREDRDITRVWFRRITPAEISGYVATGEPLDKAGAYAIQGLAAKFVERIEGSYTNVVGLPIELVRQHLRQFENA